MIWGYHYFWKHPYIVSLWNVDVFWWYRLSAFRRSLPHPEWCICQEQGRLPSPLMIFSDFFLFLWSVCVKVCVPAMVHRNSPTNTLVWSGIEIGEASVNISTGADLVDENDLSWVACFNTSAWAIKKHQKPGCLGGMRFHTPTHLYYLGGGFKDFLFSSLFGEDESILTIRIIFFKWVESTHLYYTIYPAQYLIQMTGLSVKTVVFCCILTPLVSVHKAGKEKPFLNQQPLDVDFDPRSYMMTREYHWRVLPCPLLVGEWHFGGWICWEPWVVGWNLILPMRIPPKNLPP